MKKLNTEYKIRLSAEALAKEENTKKPSWIRAKAVSGDMPRKVTETMNHLGLNSVCEEATCPNRGECWSDGHVTFMILGDVCTRGCLFCDVNFGTPAEPDAGEPSRIATGIKELDIKHAVITSVTRDDLEDKGTAHFVDVVREIKNTSPEVTVELLIPDMGAEADLIERIAFSGAEVIGHNVEMPEFLYKEVRPRSDYLRTLDVLKKLSLFRDEGGADIFVKSSMILGLGESRADIGCTLEDLKDAGVDIVYIGQYLSPSTGHWNLDKYYEPSEFDELADIARKMGFWAVCSGPMVRSSYKAQESYRSALLTRRSFDL
ncbi:MAG: lipoyl synthase [Candidatus Tantalella remota]|nr:lipoyl synthase [Candidatus Tantalella remota]